MKSVTRMPLHFQILIAMAVGAVIGLLVNPGEFELDDVEMIVAAKDSGIEVTMRHKDKPQDKPVFREKFAGKDHTKKFKERFPELAGLFEKRGDNKEITVAVTDRRVHLSENGKKVTLRYIRLHDGKKIVSTYEAADLETLQKDSPQWAAESKQVIDPYQDLPVRSFSVWSKFIGDLFLRMLRMITIPLIVTSLVVGVSGLGNTARLGSMFGKTMLYYIVTSLLAITTGIIMVNLIQPGVGAELPGGGSAVAPAGDRSLGDVFANLANNMIPPNPIHAMATGEFLSIITFSILLGLFIIKVGGQSGKTMRDFFQAGFDVMMSMTQFIIRLAPIGVFAFMLYATASQGIEIFKTFALYMLTVFLALAFHACVTLPLILYFVARRSPRQYVKAMSPALLTAFSTASSNGTLPLTMTSVEERAGISNRTSSFVLPLGATINMDGTALYEVVAVLFIAQAFGRAMSLDQQIIIAVVALLASVGAAGIPSAGLVMMTIVLQAADLPLEAVGLIIAVDRVLDMCRTSVNVWSDSCGCAVLERFESGAAAEAPVADAPGSPSR
ncbi:MAG: dicarboxylate/amino acid:cation symporter [Planctomycetes bacterium]|nr:dicarboxylate/amino acid:cation symporter [Planctomycetota bacterium]